MSKGERNRGYKVRGVIDSRPTEKKNRARIESARPVEREVISHDTVNEKATDWKRSFEDLSGFGVTTVGLISQLEAALQLRLGSRYRTTPVKPDRKIRSDITSLTEFIKDTPNEAFQHPILGDKYLAAFEGFKQRFAAVEKMFVVLTEPPADQSWVIDEATAEFFRLNYQRLILNTKAKIPTDDFWKKVDDNGGDAGWVGLPRKPEELQKGLAAASSILMSHAYSLQLFAAMTTDARSHAVLSSAYKVVRELAQLIQMNRTRFAEIKFRGVNVELDLMAEIPTEQRAEAEKIWAELLA